MLNILLYQDSEKLWEYLKDEQALKESYSIVCPSPQIADSVRKLVPQEIPVQTMAGFILNLTNSLGIDESRIKGKSELMFYLSQVCKKQFRTSHQEFLTAFHLFTQLRGVSQDEKLIETVLDDYVPQLKDWVLSFYQIMNQLNWLDEHGSYKEIHNLISVEGEMSPELQASMSKEHIVFYGFKHFTGTQVELFKGMSQFTKITFPYWKNLFDQSWPTDWIQWFSDEAQIQDISKPKSDCVNQNTKVFEASSSEFSSALKSLMISQKSIIDIMIPEKALDAGHMMMVPHNHLQFKMSYDLFDLETIKIQTQLEVIETTAKKARQIIFAKTQEVGFESAQDFREFKLLSIIDEILSLYPEEDDLGVYDWKVIFEILKLDIPRLNLTSFFSVEKSLVRLLSRQDIDDSTIKDGSFLLLSTSTNIFSTASDLYSEKVEKHISSLSPMRRSEVENGIFMNQLIELIQKKKMTILMSDNLLEKEPRWESFFAKLNVEDSELDQASNRQLSQWKLSEEKIEDQKLIENQSNASYFSATRLQTYIDCHYQYYFKYIKNIFPNYSYETLMEPREIGSLEHLIIADYCEKYDEYDDDDLRQLCLKTLDHFLVKEKKRLDSMIKSGIEEELFLLSQRGIKLNYTLSKLMKLPKKAIFERSIKDEFPEQLRSGSIDYSYWDNSQLILVDFKRGAGSIPTAKSMSSYEKIQFLFYLNVVTKKFEKLKSPLSHFMGYVCLADLEKSHIWADDDLRDALIEQGYPKSMFKKNYILDVFEKYPEYEDKLIEQIQNQQVFEPTPRKQDVCTYCDLNSICHKGAL